MTRKNAVYAGPQSPWKAQEPGSAMVRGRESVFSQIPEALVALAPVVISLTPSPSSCLIRELWDMQCPAGEALGPLPVRAQVHVLEAGATVKFWTLGWHGP